MEAPSLEDCGQQVKRVLESPSIPQHHCLLLQKLTRHFYRLCKNNSRNRLTPRILGEAFGEVLFQSPVTSTRVNPEHRVRILESLIVVGGVSEIQTAPAALSRSFHRICFFPLAASRAFGGLRLLARHLLTLPSLLKLAARKEALNRKHGPRAMFMHWASGRKTAAVAEGMEPGHQDIPSICSMIHTWAT
ncbi:hypothetical protein FKM82_002021 [Ascaphus truei]